MFFRTAVASDLAITPAHLTTLMAKKGFSMVTVQPVPDTTDSRITLLCKSDEEAGTVMTLMKESRLLHSFRWEEAEPSLQPL